MPTWWIDLCGTIDTQFHMIAPRRLVWEAGEDPNFRNGGWDVVKGIRNVYLRMGIGDRFQFVRHNGGHETRVEGLTLFPDR